MSASVCDSSSMVMKPGPDGPVKSVSGQAEVDFMKCDCCGLTEECTPSYINTVRDMYGGKWVCGLCAEAVKDEVLLCRKLISWDEAMARHLSFCNKFRAGGPPPDPTPRLIRAMTLVLRKTLESPKSMPCSPMTKRDVEGGEFTRLENCIPSLTLDEMSVFCGMDEGCE